MSNQSRTDWSDVAIVVCVFAALLLFWGSPDLLDAIIFKLTGGAVPLPKP
jgi:hypothetical protein